LPTSENIPVTVSPVSPAPGTFRDSQRGLILQTLKAANWIIGGPDGAAARLGLKRTTLFAKMKKLGISRPVRRNETSQIHEESGQPEIAAKAVE
jgi:formate hydrogenlyase transcriptional activator